MTQSLKTPQEQAVVGPHIRHANPHPQYALLSDVVTNDELTDAVSTAVDALSVTDEELAAAISDEVSRADSVYAPIDHQHQLTEIEVDFGVTPVWNKSFAINDPSVYVANAILVQPSGNAPTGLTADEWEFDAIGMTAESFDGGFTLRCVAIPGPVSGKRKIYYQVRAA